MIKTPANSEKGFSLVEVLIVVVIIGILAAMSAGFLRRAKGAAENGSAFAVMRTILSSQISYYSENKRYARFDELNAAQGGALGKTLGNTLTRGSFTFSMSPAAPTDAELATGFTVIAAKPGGAGDVPYVIQVSERGEILQILP